MAKIISGKAIVCGSTGRAGVWRCVIGDESFKASPVHLSGDINITLEKTDTIIIQPRVAKNRIECNIGKHTAICHMVEK